MPSPYQSDLGGCRLVSTRSEYFYSASLGVGVLNINLAFTEFDTIPYAVSTHKAQLNAMSPLL